MLKYYIEDYEKIMEHFEEEVKRFPDKRHELTLLYAPVINYHACRFAEQIRQDRKSGIHYEAI